VTSPDDVVVLLDCDNTLLDNDLVQDDLRDHLAREFGVESRDRYWAILEQLRAGDTWTTWARCSATGLAS
jgi:beta-phosphoglucomutase-like phosphatase (HAD superfamily)